MAFQMCAKHRAESAAWLNYKIGSLAPQIVSVGNSYAAVEARRRARYEEWRNTINTQRALILDSCQGGVGCSDNGADAFEGGQRPN